MHEFVECLECEFVYAAADNVEPKPKGQDTCPNCTGDQFDFTGG